MIHQRSRALALLCVLMCAALSGCGNSVSKASFDRIKTDGTQNLAAVEAIMGSKGKAISKEAWMKLGMNAAAYLGEREAEARVFRWGETDETWILICLVDDKAVGKLSKGIR